MLYCGKLREEFITFTHKIEGGQEFLGTKSWEEFEYDGEPTVDSHGSRYVYTVGPFDTVAGQLWFRDKNSIHCQTVEDAERQAHGLPTYPEG